MMNESELYAEFTLTDRMDTETIRRSLAWWEYDAVNKGLMHDPDYVACCIIAKSILAHREYWGEHDD